MVILLLTRIRTQYGASFKGFWFLNTIFLKHCK